MGWVGGVVGVGGKSCKQVQYVQLVTRVVSLRRRRQKATVVQSSPKSPYRAQELCKIGGGRPGLPSLISLRFLWT